MLHKKYPDRRELKCITGLAILFSVLHLLSGVKERRYYAGSPILSGIILFVLYFCAISLLFRWIQKENRKNPVPRSTQKVFQKSFLFLFVCWLPYYLLCFPGNIAYDSSTAILTYLGMESVVNNPPFLNLVFGLVYRMGTLLGDFRISVAIFCTIQALLYLCLYSYTMVLLCESRTPLWLQRSVLLLYGIVPFFPIYALCIGKDSSFGLVLLCFCLGIYEQLHDRNYYSHKIRAGIFFCACVLLPLTRNGAVIIVAVTLGILLIFLCFTPPHTHTHAHITSSYKVFLFCTLAVSILVGIFLPKLILPHTPLVGEVLSVPLQQTAYCLRKYPLTEQELDIVAKVIPLDALQNYSNRTSDPIKAHFRNDAPRQDILNFLMVWLRQFFKHPISYFKAFYLHTDAYYTPGVLHNDVKPHLLLGLKGPVAFRELVNWSPRYIGMYYITVIDDLFTNTIGLRLLQSIGLYTWVLLFSIVWCIGSTSKKGGLMLLPLIPAVLVLVGCCFSPVNGYFRYAYPAVVCIPFSCILTLFPPDNAAAPE